MCIYMSDFQNVQSRSLQLTGGCSDDDDKGVCIAGERQRVHH